MKSTLTVAELQAAALLLGEEWWYHPSDHTFNCNINDGIDNDHLLELDADTMEPVPLDRGMIGVRTRAVQNGEKGAKDYGEWQQATQGGQD